MDTASQVFVATAIAVVIGIPIGIWAAENPRVERALRLLLDTLQTLPQLVYIIPFIYLMPVSLVPGVVASVLYAIPVIIRLVTAGIRGVPPAPVEAAQAFGASNRQVLAKVKLPLARESIMLGVNQGMIMVLSVVVIAGLVGSGALGDLVARGLQRNEFGEGVVASIAILASASPRPRDPRKTESANRRRGSLNSHRKLWAVVAALMLALALAACGESKDDDDGGGERVGGGKDRGKVVLNEQAWAGSTANTYIAKACSRTSSAATSRSRRSPRSSASRRWRTATTRCSRTGSTSTSTSSTSTRPAPSSRAGRSASRAISAGSSRSS